MSSDVASTVGGRLQLFNECLARLDGCGDRGGGAGYSRALLWGVVFGGEEVGQRLLWSGAGGASSERSGSEGLCVAKVAWNGRQCAVPEGGAGDVGSVDGESIAAACVELLVRGDDVGVRRGESGTQGEVQTGVPAERGVQELSGLCRCGGAQSVGIGSVSVEGRAKDDVVGVCSGVVDGSGVDAAVVVGSVVGGEGSQRPRGKWYEHNKKKKQRRRDAAAVSVPEWRRKPAIREDDAVSDESQTLQRSLQEKWTAENRLAKLRAEQQYELLRARDLERVKKMQAAQVMRTTEQAKVQTEKAFGFLAKTGNIPGVVGEGYVEGTVLTNATPGLTRSAGDTISPDSSASMHEYRQALKAVADAEKKNADLERALAQLRITAPRETAEAEKYAGARTTFTLDTDGEPPVADEGFVGDDGKYHTYQRLTHPDWTPSMEKAMAKQGFDLSYGDYSY